ncbi:MAG: hypothetical protein AB7G06_06680 [Bdellovibrionales bacterium]
MTLILILATPVRAAVLSSDPLTQDELDAQRGGFMMAGGLVLDFALVHKSMVNGEVQNAFQLSSQDFINNVDVGQLVSVIQLGNNVGGATLSDIPGLVSIIRNSLDNAVIQNLNTMELSVSNMQSVKDYNALATLRDAQLLTGRY